MSILDVSKDMMGQFSVFVREIGDESNKTLRRVGGGLDSPPQSNIITDLGWKEFLLGGTDFRVFAFHERCWVGTGTTEHTAESVDLGNRISYNAARRNSSGSSTIEVDGINYYRCRNEYLLTSSSIRGVPISEIAVGRSAYNMYAGQLIKDETGNPTTIILKDNEEMILRYDILYRKYSESEYTKFGEGIYRKFGEEYPYIIEGKKLFNPNDNTFNYRGYKYNNRLYINGGGSSKTPSRVQTDSIGKTEWDVSITISGGESHNINTIDYQCAYGSASNPDLRIRFLTPLPKEYDESLTIKFKYGVKWREA